MIKHAHILLGILSFISFSLTAQIDSTWIKTYGGDRVDKALDIISTPDHGYMVIGTTSSFGLDNAQMYFLKLDSLGNILWSKNYGGINQEWGHSVINTHDGGYLGVGYTNSKGSGGFDAYLVKLGHDGSYQYERTFGGYHWDFAYDVVQVDTGLFAIAGETKSIGNGNSDAWLFMYNEQTDTFEWQTTVGDSLNDNFKSVILNHNNELVAAGGTHWNGNIDEDILVSKFDLTGINLTNWHYGDTLTDFANDIIQLDSSHYAATGQTFNQQFGVVISYLKIDTMGLEIFNDPWAIGFENPQGAKIMKIDSGRTAIAGTVQGFGVASDYFVGYSYPHSPSYQNGATLGSFKIDQCNSATFYGNGYFLVGFTDGFGLNYENVLIYKTDYNGRTSSNIYETIKDSVNITSTPSLSKSFYFRFNNNDIILPEQGQIEYLRVIDILGREYLYIQNPSRSPVNHNLPKGIYVCSYKINGQIISQKFVVR